MGLQEITDEIIALAIVLGAVFAILFGVVTGKTVELPSWFTAIVGMVVAYYFSKRKGR